MTYVRNLIGRLWPLTLHPLAVAMASCIFVLIVRRLENIWTYVPFVISVTLLVAAFIFIFSNRIVFSIYTAQVLVLFQSLASIVKFGLKGLAFHAYDLFFTGTDLSAMRFLLELYGVLFLGAAAVLAVACVALYWIFRLEQPVSWRLRRRSLALGIVGGFTYFLYPSFGKDSPSYSPFIEGNDVSAFPISVGQLKYPFSQIALAERLGLVDVTDTFSATASCGEDRRTPDVVLVLSESQTSPELLSGIALPRKIIDSYRSGDGKIHSLFVETFGGGTWQTNFSMLTGLSTADFGWQAPYVTQLMENRIKDSLPQMLAGCGYRTVSVMPMEYNFVNEGNFQTSIGIQEVYDAAAMQLSEQRPRDSVYFEFARKLMAEHRKRDRRPIFVTIQTMHTHGPYSGEIPENAATFRSLTDDPFLNEYLARVAASREDLLAFRDGLSMDPGHRGTIFLEFGDHQSVATRAIFEKMDGTPNPYADFRSPVYRTYFSVHGFNASVDYDQFSSDDDVVFLPARLVAAARLPDSPTWHDLRKLADLCAGRFHRCPDRFAVDRHLKRRVNGGLLAIH